MIQFVDPVLGLIRSLFGGYRREFRNIGWLVADRAIRVLGTLLLGIVAARLIGPAAYGGISYAQTLTAFLTLAVAVGLNSVVVKAIVDQPGDTSAVIGTAIAVQATAVALTLACLVLQYAWSTPDPANYTQLVPIVALGLLLRPTEPLRYLFEAHVNAKFSVLADNAAFLIAAAIKVLVLVYAPRVEVLVWAIVVEQWLGGLALIVAFRLYGDRPPPLSIKLSIAKDLLIQSYPLLLSGLAVGIYMRIDQFVIMAQRGAFETGLYAAATRITEIFYVVPTIVASSFFPRWQRMMTESPERYEAVVGATMRWFAAVMTIVAIVIGLVAQPAIILIYGPAYAMAWPILAVHIWTCVFVCYGVLGNQWYLMHGLQGRTLLCTLLGAGTNLATNVILVPRFGALGGAIASLTAQIVSTLLADALSVRTRPLLMLKLRGLAWPLALISAKARA